MATPSATADFIRRNMRLEPVAPVPGIRLFQAHAGSGLNRLPGRRSGAPYWAYAWPGGVALARHFLENPEAVAGHSLLDLGAGSGLVAIAAARAGAGKVAASDTDPAARAAIGLNAEANGVAVEIISDDILAGSPPPFDIVAVGDLFYDRELAGRVTEFLERCVEAGIVVLVGDLGREWLPRARLRLLAEYPVAEIGEPRDSARHRGMVFAFDAGGAHPSLPLEGRVDRSAATGRVG